jgi:hypothetical protein
MLRQRLNTRRPLQRASDSYPPIHPEGTIRSDSCSAGEANPFLAVWRRIELFRPASRKPFPATPGRKYPAFSGTPCKMCSFKTAASIDLSDEKLQDTGRNHPPKTGGPKGHIFGSRKKNRTPRPEQP